MDQRRLLGLSGRLYSSPISDFWQVSTTDQDPSIPNLPLETAESGAPVDQPQDSDWDWDEQLPTDLFILGYQNSDVTPVLSQAFGDDWDWSESLDDEWSTDQQLQPVVVVPARQQDTDWNWDETLSPEIISGGYQQADNAPEIDAIQHTDDVWGWDEYLDDQWGVDESPTIPVAAASPVTYNDAPWDWDEVLSPEIVVNGYQQADNTPAPSPDQVFDTGWEFEAVSDEDGWSNHFTNYDPIVVDPIQHTHSEWDWDEVVYPDLIVNGYQNADNTPEPSADAAYNDAWDWNEQVYDEWTTDETLGANYVAPVDPVSYNDAEWDWDEVLFSDVTVSGYQQADVEIVPGTDQPQTDWDFESIVDEDGWSNHFTNYEIVVPVPEFTDTHDGFWRKQYQKMFAHKPKLAEVVEIIQQNPKEAVAAVREIEEVRRVVYERYPDIDYSQVINDARIALFIAQNLLNAIELQRIQDEEDDLLIMLLLSL